MFCLTNSILFVLLVMWHYRNGLRFKGGTRQPWNKHDQENLQRRVNIAEFWKNGDWQENRHPKYQPVFYPSLSLVCLSFCILEPMFFWYRNSGVKFFITLYMSHFFKSFFLFIFFYFGTETCSTMHIFQFMRWERGTPFSTTYVCKTIDPCHVPRYG